MQLGKADSRITFVVTKSFSVANWRASMTVSGANAQYSVGTGLFIELN
jgi:hypothetical protein